MKMTVTSEAIMNRPTSSSVPANPATLQQHSTMRLSIGEDFPPVISPSSLLTHVENELAQRSMSSPTNRSGDGLYTLVMIFYPICVDVVVRSGKILEMLPLHR